MRDVEAEQRQSQQMRARHQGNEAASQIFPTFLKLFPDAAESPPLALGVHHTSLLRFVRGDRTLTLDTAEKLMAYCGIEARHTGGE